ncbi:hypothetical protein [Neobacillus niacini]|uniref:hypothetical protein n=1 Tax=Neobacillus niacini TaxID=86668 RepID=UPI003000C529
MGDFYNYLSSNYEQIINLLGQHIYLSIVSVLIAVIIGIPLGILISREPKLSKTIIGTTNVIQAVPSLALLGFLIPFIGIGRKCTCHCNGCSIFPSSNRKEHLYRINEY